MIIEFNQEHFEAWLLSQNPNRKLALSQGGPDDQPGCLLSNFARETLGGRWNCGWMSMSSLVHRGIITCPVWMSKLIGVRSDTTTMGEMQAKYRELFPDPTPEPTPAIAEAVRK